ncbi:hypothetical protein [Loktanella sp. M215]|uniref:hypothetical protein n=1 Tax=Loktanella sp. M215 TaxID=2675431 RepID=UPI001F246098|nr:hypothetical protein [Loktanella sp. M215]MCF7700542.1 hypothetical protein [Loktanella sp. M215]
MTLLSTTDLARTLKVTTGRVSQYVSEGKLEGCYTGSGRQRRFDLSKCADALGRRLDQGQMLGNGSRTKVAIQAVRAGDDGDDDRAPVARQRSDTPLRPNDPDLYELARTQKVTEEARRARRQNELDEGSFVLAAEAARQTARIVAQEIAGFETVLREAARKIADTMGVDYKVARKILLDTWRGHRAVRSEALAEEAEEAPMTDAERAADF